MSDITSGPDVFADTNADGKRPGLMVILFGLLTTVIALVIVYMMQTIGIQPMGFYMMLIFPVGALLVGIVAGSGYALGSWWTGAKLGGGLLILVLVLQLLAYFAAQFIEFNNFRATFENRKDEIILSLQESAEMEMDEATCESVWQEIKESSGANSFLSYFDMMTRTFAFDDANNKPGRELGLWGYGIRVLEILGFCFGSLIGPLMLMATPYCSECQVYQKTKQIGILPAGIKPRKIKKKDTQGQQDYEEEVESALQGGLQLAEETIEFAKAGNSMEFVAMLTSMKENKKDIAKQTSRIVVNLVHCPSCHSGVLQYQLQTGIGDKLTTEEVAQYDAEKSFVREIKMSL